MEEIFHAVAQIAREHSASDIVFPVHLNPVVQAAAQSILSA
jgi:UDP-N-acetylglucosamine 2-epimerase